MIGTTNVSNIRMVGGIIASNQMSTITSAGTTYRYKDITYTGFSAPPMVLVCLNYTVNNDYGSVPTAVTNITATGARIMQLHFVSTSIEKVNWMAFGI